MPDVLVLCYHAVSHRWDAALSVTPAALRGQLSFLVSRGWVGATFTEAVTSPPASRTLAVTFDDGFDSVRTLGAPILDELGLPGTVFVPTDWPGRVMRWPGIEQWADTAFAHELQAMSWDQLRSLSARGWEIGAHTCSHPRLSQLDPGAVERELGEGRATCEREIGAVCRSVAYPFGDATERIRAAAAAARYDAAAGLFQRAIAPPDRFGWPRLGVWHDDGERRFRLKVGAAVSIMRAARSRSALQRIRPPSARRPTPV
jgi:peptidoglycan/xylan/chitin deacetylase (PgdA/CDA1 family)